MQPVLLSRPVTLAPSLGPPSGPASGSGPVVLLGDVVGVRGRATSEFVATLRQLDTGRDRPPPRRGVCIPLDPRPPRFTLATCQAPQLQGQRLLLRRADWAPQSPYPVAQYVRALGPVGDREAETEALLREHGLPLTPIQSCPPPKLPELGVPCGPQRIGPLPGFIFGPSCLKNEGLSLVKYITFYWTRLKSVSHSQRVRSHF